MLFTHATASRIKSFKECQFKYFLEYMVQYPPMRGDNVYTAKGSAVHEALEAWTNFKLGVEKTKGGPPVEEDWRETLRKYYEKSKLWEMDERKPEKGGHPHPVEKTCESCPWATKDKRCEIANTAIDAVNGCPRPNFEDDVALVVRTLTRKDYPVLALDDNGNFKRKILGAEVPFETKLGGVKVRGVIDLVAEEDKETLEIIDYKTGKSMSYDKAEKDAQVRIYAAVARQMWPQYKYIHVTLHYLKKRPVMVPFGPDDDELTIKSLQVRSKQIIDNKDPRQVTPSKWGYPCDWCVGYQNCLDIKDKFRVDGKFRLPTISCGFTSKSEPCYGNLHPVKGQEIGIENVNEIIYSCKGHSEVHGGGKYVPEPADSNSFD